MFTIRQVGCFEATNRVVPREIDLSSLVSDYQGEGFFDSRLSSIYERKQEGKR